MCLNLGCKLRNLLNFDPCIFYKHTCFHNIGDAKKKQKNMSFLMRVLSVNVPSWKSLRSSDVVEINSCCNAKVSSLRRKWWRTNPWKQTKLATTLKWFCTPKLNLKQPYQFKLRHLHPESLLPCQSCWVEHLSLTPRRCMACDVVNVKCITESTPQLS